MRNRNSKPSFFQRLTGTINIDDEFEYREVDEVTITSSSSPQSKHQISNDTHKDWLEDTEPEGELALDMHQTANEIVINTMVAGVRPDDLEISITREMVTVRGRREGPVGIDQHDYFHRELYWGPFSRTVVLPAEVEVEEAEATETHGLLVIRLPKIDKAKQTKLTVKSRSL